MNASTQPLTVSIIIPAKNEAGNIARVLSALQQAISEYPGQCEVLLVDNGSSDATCEIAAAYGCTVYVDKTASIARLRNIGAEQSSGAILAFLDADCLVDRHWISSCVEKLSDQRIGLVGTRAIPDFTDATWVETGWYKLISGVDRPDFPNWVGSSNMFIPRDLFTVIGGFDEQLATAEDVNLCHKVRQTHLICLNKRITTIHLRESKTLGNLLKRELWRGKGSIRQFVESNRKRDDAPSVLVPALQMACSCAAVGILPLNHTVSGLLLLVILLLPLAMIIKKKALLRSVSDFVQVYPVAFVYLLARSLAIGAELIAILSTVAGGRFMPTSPLKQSIIRHLLLPLLVASFVPVCYGETIFEENFDTQPDWNRNNRYTTECSGNCSTAPKNWSNHRTVPGISTLPHPTGSIQKLPDNSPDHGTGNGKAYIVYNQSVAGVNWPGDSTLVKVLAKEYPELYVRFWIKTQANWKTVANAQSKIFRAYHWDRTGNIFEFFSTGTVNPAYIWDWSTNRSNNASYMHAFRCDPQETNYYCTAPGVPSYQLNDYFRPWKSGPATSVYADSRWHRYDFHLKMNEIGKNNGMLEWWWDGNLMESRTDVQWKAAAGSEASIGWNTISFGGNSNNTFSAAPADQWYAIDDIMVSTTPFSSP